MSEILDRAAMAAFWNWRSIPKVPEAEIVATWKGLPDAAKEPWLRTARVVIAAIREPTEEMALRGGLAIPFFGDSTETETGQYIEAGQECWKAMIDEVLR